MADKIILTQGLVSGKKAIIFETKTGMEIEVGGGCIPLEEKDLYGFIRLLKEVDRHFLGKE